MLFGESHIILENDKTLWTLVSRIKAKIGNIFGAKHVEHWKDFTEAYFYSVLHFVHRSAFLIIDYFKVVRCWVWLEHVSPQLGSKIELRNRMNLFMMLKCTACETLFVMEALDACFSQQIRWEIKTSL